MKIELSDNMTISARRTLKSLKDALMSRLEKRSLDEITVIEICDSAMVPRTTFYNYFEDKFDLLRYCNMNLESKILPSGLDGVDGESYLTTVLSNMIDYFSNNIGRYRRICRANEGGSLFNEFTKYAEAFLVKRLSKREVDGAKWRVPLVLIAKVYAGALVSAGVWWLTESANVSKEEMVDFFAHLIINDTTAFISD